MKSMVAIALIMASFFSCANGLDNAKQTQELSEQMVAYFVKAEFTRGLSLAKEHWPLPEVEIDGLAN